MAKLSHLTDEVQEEFALGADQAGQQLGDPGQPLDGGDPDTVLVDGLCQGVLVVVKTQQPKHLKEQERNKQLECRCAHTHARPCPAGKRWGEHSAGEREGTVT